MGDFKKCFHNNVNYNENIKQWIVSIQKHTKIMYSLSIYSQFEGIHCMFLLFV